MKYEIDFSELAKIHLSEMKKSDPSSFKKAVKLLKELSEHPRTGTGNPEMLKNDLAGYWSRRINKKDRLVYRINDDELFVFTLRVKGHYNDK